MSFIRQKLQLFEEQTKREEAQAALEEAQAAHEEAQAALEEAQEAREQAPVQLDVAHENGNGKNGHARDEVEANGEEGLNLAPLKKQKLDIVEILD